MEKIEQNSFCNNDNNYNITKMLYTFNNNVTPKELPSMTLEELPIEIILKIAKNLPEIYDLFALELTSHKLNTILLEYFWPHHVHALAFHSLYKENFSPAYFFESPGTGKAHETNEENKSQRWWKRALFFNYIDGRLFNMIYTPENICQVPKKQRRLYSEHFMRTLFLILGRCGHNLRVLNLAIYTDRIMFLPISDNMNNVICSLTNGEVAENDDANFSSTYKIAKLYANFVDEFAQQLGAQLLPTIIRLEVQLYALDLSFIPLNGRSLMSIGTATGATLRVLRLKKCIEDVRPGLLDYPSSEQLDENRRILPSDFTNFLSDCPNLLELDISGCFFDEDLCFSAVSTKLCHFKAFNTRISIVQLIQVATRSPNISHLAISSKHSYMDNGTQEQLDTLFILLTNSLEVLWIFFQSVHLALRLPARVCQQLRCLRIYQDDDAENPFISSFLEQPVSDWHGCCKFPNLRELYIAMENCGPEKFHNFGTLANALTLLSLSYCCSVDDNSLEYISKIGTIEKLTIVFCKNVTWRGFAFFLQFCPNVRMFHGSEQMTDELLEQVMRTMDKRQQRHWHHPHSNRSNDKNDDNGKLIGLPTWAWDNRLFIFIRNQNTPTRSKIADAAFLNANSVQSLSQNLHPWIVYRQPALREEMLVYDGLNIF